MFIEDWYKNYRPLSGFAEDRGNYKHAGIDPSDEKGTTIKCLLDSVLDYVEVENKYHGNKVVLRSNCKYINGPDELLYHSYCHLFEIAELPKKDLIKAGSKLGTMGNSGKCYTGWQIDGTYNPEKMRVLTQAEIDDENCSYGSHLHVQFHQKAKPGKVTQFLKELFKLKLASKQTVGDTHFWQWGELFIAPRVVYAYFKLKKGNK